MALWTTLKAAVDAVITTNGNNEITGAILNTILDTIIDDVGLYQFKGVATPSTSPGTPDGSAWYIASQVGSYPNFGGAVVTAGSIAFFKWDGTAWNMELLTGVTGETQYVKKFQDLAAEEVYATPEKSLLTQIIVKGKTGTTNFKAGSSSGAEDISRAKDVAAGAFLTVTKAQVYETAQNIYIGITGGTADVTLIFTTNIIN